MNNKRHSKKIKSIRRANVTPDIDLPLASQDVLEQINQHTIKVSNILKTLRKAFNLG